jgi:hypothetical protein
MACPAVARHGLDLAPRAHCARSRPRRHQRDRRLCPLVAANVGERGAAVAGLETQDGALAARIEVAAHTVADLDRRLGEIDTAIEEAAKRGKPNTALSAMEGQRRARAGLASERNEAAGTLRLPGRARPPD